MNPYRKINDRRHDTTDTNEHTQTRLPAKDEVRGEEAEMIGQKRGGGGVVAAIGVGGVGVGGVGGGLGAAAAAEVPLPDAAGDVLLFDGGDDDGRTQRSG